MVRRIQAVKAFIAALVLSIVVFGFISGCDDSGGGGGMNCCQFTDRCQEFLNQQDCKENGGAFFPNAECVVDPDLDLGLCIAISPPTPPPSPSPSPSPTPSPTSTPMPTPSPTPSPTASPGPTPTPGQLTCDDLSDNMTDLVFQENAVRYMCMVDSNDVVEVLTSDGSDCTIVFNTMVEFQQGVSIRQIMLMGPISMDGTTCDFAGTTAIVVLEDDNVVPAQVNVDSGTATLLTSSGKVLGLSDIEVVNFADSPVTIPGFNCDCQSVEPIDQQARTQDAQSIQRQMMEDYSIDTGN